MTALSTPSAAAALQRGLERLGWQIQSAEFDLANETARIEIRGQGCLLITFDARNGRATTTREILERRVLFIPQVRGGYFTERIEPRFLGRTAHEGARSGLRWLCGYLADNSAAGALPSDVRRLVAPLMDGQKRAFTFSANTC